MEGRESHAHPSKRPSFPLSPRRGDSSEASCRAISVPGQPPLKKVLDAGSTSSASISSRRTAAWPWSWPTRQTRPGAVRDGKQSGLRTGIPGLIFYNNLGDEIGGLIYPLARSLEPGLRRRRAAVHGPDQADRPGFVSRAIGETAITSARMLEITDYSTEKVRRRREIEDPEIVAGAGKGQGRRGKRTRRGYSGGSVPAAARRKGYLAHRVFLGSEGSTRRRAMLELKDSRSRPRIRPSSTRTTSPASTSSTKRGAWSPD
ncbi:MAG: hypothetical protein M0C28_00415 [Candidatus Moduliflexus flocculans]|nr:hypothetical protein [Candidatus Moduliflexus flocculans]